MFISRDWLQDFIVELSDHENPKTLADILTLHTVEVEGWVDFEKELSGVVVGVIKSIEKHPSADKLSIAKIDIGKEKLLQVVFGQAAVVHVGDKVPVSVAPTVLPGGKCINKTNLRGVVSEGMLCLEEEMGISKNAGNHLPEISDKFKPGAQITDALDLFDVVYDIDNKSITHRPDLWSVYGIAREVAALKKSKLKQYPFKITKGGSGKKLKIKVLEKHLCPRYMAVHVTGIEKKETPKWIKRRLELCGVKSISPVVDITNYVMLETGQPLHAFDAGKVGTGIVVRRAVKGEKLLALNGVEYDLKDEYLVIANEKTPIAIAGIIGGVESSVTENTKEIIIEAANFNAISVRKTSASVGLRTESLMRFEKSLDPLMTEVALHRVLGLIKEIFPESRVTSAVEDIANYKIKELEIELKPEEVSAKIGVVIDAKKIKELLTPLGFFVASKKKSLFVRVPSWRTTGDINIKEDLTEEVARMYGYDKIPPILPAIHVSKPVIYEESAISRRLRSIFIDGLRYIESSSYSFISEKDINLFGENIADYVKIANPLSQVTEYVRRNLHTGLVKAVAVNEHEFNSIKLFEEGKVALKEFGGARLKDKSDELLPYQPNCFSAIISQKDNNCPWREAREAMLMVQNTCGFAFELVLAKDQPKYMHIGRSAAIMIGEKKVGSIFELSPKFLRRVGLENRAAIIEFNLTVLADFYNPYKSNYVPMQKFPPVKRDISIEVANNLEQQKIADYILNSNTIVTGVELFDVYRKKEVSDKKSLAFHIIFSDQDKTLLAADVDKIFAKIIDGLKTKFGAVLHI